MSVDTSKLINVAKLNHYNSRLQEQVIAPIEEAIDNVATNVDVGYYCFSAGTISNATKSSIQTMSQSQIETVNADDVTDMSELFQNRSDITSLDLSNWDVSDVTDMTDMFDGCSNLTSLKMSGSLQTDLDLSDTALTAQSANEFSEGIDPKVTNEDVEITMPRSAKRMNRTLATSKGYGVTITPVVASIVVTDANKSNFKSNVKNGTYDADFISRADVSAVTNMGYMFESCSSLTSLDLSDWNVSSVTNMYEMFDSCSSLTSLNLSNWDVSSVTNMSRMFYYCSSLTSLDLSDWNVSEVTDISQMFLNCPSLTSLDLSGWDVSAVTDMKDVFLLCNSLTSLEGISSWDVSAVMDMRGMFSDCSSLTSLDLSGWDVSSVTAMYTMFSSCSSLSSLGDISSWNVSAVTDLNNLFSNCSSLASLDLSGWDVSSVTDMRSMFYNCSSLTSLDLSDWDVSAVIDMSNMFNNCSKLTSLLIGGAINTNLDLSSTKLTPQAANAFFNGISAKTTENAVTIAMPSTAQGADISIATAKGYTISGIS